LPQFLNSPLSQQREASQTILLGGLRFSPAATDYGHEHHERTKNMKTITKLIYAAFAAVTLAIGALAPNAFGVSPPPDGGYPGFNTAEGDKALFSLTTGVANTAVGWFSLFSNAEGSFNTATGTGALLFNIADNNTAFGAAALLFNTTGINNTAVGTAALSNNTEGQENTATGRSALGINTTGNWNTANGAFALAINQTGIENTAYGQVALSNVTGSKNVGIGAAGGCKLTTGSNNIAIVNPGVAGESNTIRIGAVGTETNCADFPLPAHTATYIAGISGQTTSGGVAVYINSDGKLGTLTSSARFKDEIEPMDKASEAVLALKPVTFRYKHEVDPKSIPQFGLVAEDVEKVNPELVARDADNKPYTVRYEAVNAMLLNEFLKAHQKMAEQGATIARQQGQIEALTEGLQKVSAQVEMSRSAPHIVAKIVR
jgi:Chaperone of endosialidase